jgi:L-arabinokinase
VPTLLKRVRAELPDFGRSKAAAFGELRPGGGRVRISRAPGRLDVMGGIADYTGSLVCEGTLDRAAAVALAPRDDRQVQVFSFNLFDEHRPFTLRMSLDALAGSTIEQLRAGFDEAGRKWAGYLVGCLYVLHEARLIDLADPKHAGVDLALYSTVPLGAGVSSSAAVEVATMMNLLGHFGLEGAVDPMRVATLCQRVENQIVGAPCGIMDQVASCAGRAGALIKLLCQPHELQGSIELPAGTRVLGINTNVRHSVGGGQYGRTRCAAFMGHRMILAKMDEMGRRAGLRLVGDPTRGYLANLDLDDYKKFFRQFMPERMRGRGFIAKYSVTSDAATRVDPDAEYAVRGATDHHVHEAQRVRNFVTFLEQAGAMPPHSPERGLTLDKAGHLMYASHVSYTRDALLGADEADVLVELVRSNEREGFYGAKITGGGSGGTVAVLANTGERTDAAVARIVEEYRQRTGRVAEVFGASSPGAWEVGTEVVGLAHSE